MDSFTYAVQQPVSKHRSAAEWTVCIGIIQQDPASLGHGVGGGRLNFSGEFPERTYVQYALPALI